MFGIYEGDEDEPVALLSERIITGMESRYSREMVGKSLGFTTAEGKFGIRLMKEALKNRSSEEKVVDRIAATAKDAGISDDIKNTVISLLPKIPDIEYKSAIGLLLGYMAKNHIKSIPLSESDKARLKYIFSIPDSMEKNFKISPIDVIRYARLYNLRVIV